MAANLVAMRTTIEGIATMRMIEQGPHKVACFDSADAYADYQEAIPSKYKDYMGLDNWAGGSHAANLAKLRNGSNTNLERVQYIVNTVDVGQLLANNMLMLEHAMAGFVPNVSAYIAGQPETMFDLVESEQKSPVTPIRVVVETTVSSGVTHTELVNRGIAMCAFVLALNTVRPVELHVIGVQDYDHGHGACIGHMVKVFDKYADLGRALFMLTETGFARALHFPSISNLQQRMCNVGTWPFNHRPGQSEYEAKIRDLLQLEPQDIFICGGFLTNKEMLNEPVKWVNDMVKQHSGA